ncbi:hypothetical protein NPJ82_01675 [Sphingomonas sp. NY01]|uniref:hypothetical protein n=1 Tax=Sphingomonas sp. NY01 TaxID=2968057 RepID=UPI00315C932E
MDELIARRDGTLLRRAAPKGGRTGWTKAKRKRFLDVLSATCNQTSALKAAGVAKSTLYALKRRDGEFARLCGEALAFGYDQLEQELVARALGQMTSDHNPEEIGEGEGSALPEFDPVLAMQVLKLRDGRGGAGVGAGAGRKGAAPPSQHEHDVMLLKRIDAIARRVERAQAGGRA